MRISFGSVEMEENHLSDQHIEPLSGYSSFDFGTSFIFNDSFTEPSFYSFSEPPLARVDVVEGNNYVANDLADFFAFDDNATDMTMSNLSNEFELDVGSTYRVSAVDEEPQIHKRLLESVAPLIDCVDVDSVDLMNTTSECEASQSGTSSTDDAVTIHQYGWTPVLDPVQKQNNRN